MLDSEINQVTLWKVWKAGPFYVIVEWENNIYLDIFTLQTTNNTTVIPEEDTRVF